MPYYKIKQIKNQPLFIFNKLVIITLFYISISLVSGGTNYNEKAINLSKEDVIIKIKEIDNETIKKLSILFSTAFELEPEYNLHELLLEKLLEDNNKDFICSNLSYNLAIIKEYTLAEYFLNQISESSPSDKYSYYDKQMIESEDWIGIPMFSRRQSYEAQIAKIKYNYKGKNQLFHRIIIINRLIRQGFVDQALTLTFNGIFFINPKKSLSGLSDMKNIYTEINGKKFPAGQVWSGKLKEAVAYNDAQDDNRDIIYNIIIPNISVGLSLDILSNNINKIAESSIPALAKYKIFFKMLILIDAADNFESPNHSKIKNNILQALEQNISKIKNLDKAQFPEKERLEMAFELMGYYKANSNNKKVDEIYNQYFHDFDILPHVSRSNEMTKTIYKMQFDNKKKGQKYSKLFESYKKDLKRHQEASDANNNTNDLTYHLITGGKGNWWGQNSSRYDANFIEKYNITNELISGQCKEIIEADPSKNYLKAKRFLEENEKYVKLRELGGESNIKRIKKELNDLRLEAYYKQDNWEIIPEILEDMGYDIQESIYYAFLLAYEHNNFSQMVDMFKLYDLKFQNEKLADIERIDRIKAQIDAGIMPSGKDQNFISQYSPLMGGTPIHQKLYGSNDRSYQNIQKCLLADYNGEGSNNPDSLLLKGKIRSEFFSLMDSDTTKDINDPSVFSNIVLSRYSGNNLQIIFNELIIRKQPEKALSLYLNVGSRIMTRENFTSNLMLITKVAYERGGINDPDFVTTANSMLGLISELGVLPPDMVVEINDFLKEYISGSNDE